MYNLKINGQQVTNLRLSGENISKIFTGVIKQWNDPAIVADNPGLTMPARAIVPVVRSDGSGASAQFTLWMIARHKAIWDAFCQASGRAPKCGSTSFYPTPPGGIAQSGDLGVTGYVSQGFAEGAIGYVNYSYALGVQFPVVKVLNAGGYYTEPTPENVAVSLLQAKINNDESNPATYLTQDLSGVYTNDDPRNYELSSYSYFILPTKVGGQFNEAKGRTLGAFSYYAMCQAQQQSASLGYSPLPINLVTASFDQIAKIPGVDVADRSTSPTCNNPTFSARRRERARSERAAAAGVRQAGPIAVCDRHRRPAGSARPLLPQRLRAEAVPQVPQELRRRSAQQPVAQRPAAQQPVAQRPVAQRPVGQQRAGQQRAGQRPAGRQPAAQRPMEPVPHRAPRSVTRHRDLRDRRPKRLVVVWRSLAGRSAQSSRRRSIRTPGWGAKQTLMLVVVLFTLGLVLVPAYAWRKMAKTPAQHSPRLVDQACSAGTGVGVSLRRHAAQLGSRSVGDRVRVVVDRRFGRRAPTSLPGSQGTDTSLPPTESAVTVTGRDQFAESRRSR